MTRISKTSFLDTIASGYERYDYITWLYKVYQYTEEQHNFSSLYNWTLLCVYVLETDRRLSYQYRVSHYK